MILVCIVYFLVILLLLRKNGNIVEIDIFFCLYWFFFVTVAVLIFDNEYPIDFKTVGWIFSVTFVFGFWYRIGKKVTISYKIRNFFGNTDLNVSCLESSLSFVFLILVVYNIFLLLKNGLFTTSFMDIFSASRRLRYEPTVSDGSLISKVFGLVEYSSFAVFGYVFHALSKKSRIRLIFFFVIQILLATLLSGAKSAIIFRLIFFFVGFIIEKIYEGGVAIKTINYKLVIGIVVVFLLVMKKLMSTGTSTISFYGFGEVPAFNYFFKNFDGELTYGKQTFYGLYKLIKSNSHFEGIYDNYPLSSNSPIDTNIFTAFRCVITDYGYLGGILFHSFLGIIAGICTNNKNTVRMALLSWILGYICLSFLISIGYYFTLAASLLLFPFFLSIYNRFNFGINIRKQK